MRLKVTLTVGLFVATVFTYQFFENYRAKAMTEATDTKLSQPAQPASSIASIEQSFQALEGEMRTVTNIRDTTSRLPEANISNVVYAAPEADDPGIVYAAPEADDPGIIYAAPEADDPGLLYPAPEFSDPVNPN